jgi:peptidoglycan/xylan/chitin deacetylase (PgdA/CDA1 family)
VSATVAITFDNLGEVSDLQRGRWPRDAPLGHHDSVTRALPRVLALLSEVGLPATFFVEGLNTELYPDALREIAAAGHEVAYHGWRHEHWADLDAARERELLARGAGALTELGLAPVGFRPPGGELGPVSIDALAAAGFAYCSPAGEVVGVRDGVVVLPFDWSLIDAFHYLPHFAPRRQAALGAPDPLSPASLRTRVSDALSGAAERSGFLALLFHPFLVDTEERLATVRAILDHVRALIEAGNARCAPMRDIAAWVRAGHGAGAGPAGPHSG